MAKMKIQIQIKMVRDDDAELLNSMFGSSMFHWHPEFRLKVGGKTKSSWARRSNDDLPYVELAAEAREKGVKIFPDQIRKVWSKVVNELRKERQARGIAEYRAECERDGKSATRKGLKKAKFRYHGPWWMASSGSTNRKEKTVTIG